MAHAEIAQIWPRDGRLRLVGSLHGQRQAAGAAGEWRLLAVLRGEEERILDFPVPLDGAPGPGSGRFDVSAPVADFVPDDLPVPAQWDLYLSRIPSGDTGSGARRLRAGRLLDDIKGKKKIMVFPAQPVTAAGRKVLVKPYYTVHDNVSVECRPHKA